MKIVLAILVCVIASAVAYFTLQLIFTVVDKLHDKWIYNKGRCRECGGTYRFFNRIDDYEFHECTKCGQMILIKKSNIK